MSHGRSQVIRSDASPEDLRVTGASGRWRAGSPRRGTWITFVAVLLTAPANLLAGDDDTLVVRLIDGATGELLPETDVAVSLEGERAPEPLRHPNAAALRSDREGRIVVRGGRTAGAVRATRLGSGGRSAVPGDASEVLVALAPHGDQIVQVVDSTGRPRAGIPVRVEQAGAWPGSTAQTSGTYGTLAVPHQNVHESMPPRRASVFLPFASEVGAELPRKSAGTGATLVRIQLPPTTRVQVDVAGAGDSGAVARILDPGVWMSEESDACVPVVPVTSGRATLDPVPTGRTLMLEVRSRDPSRPVCREIVTTPAAGGPPLTVTATIGRARATLAGRLVDASGAPLGGRRLGIALQPTRLVAWDRWSQRPRRMPVSGADGSFIDALDRDAAELHGAFAEISELRPRPENNGGVDVYRIATLGPFAPREDGTIDLGDIVVRATRTLVVSVRDEGGAPVDRARIVLLRKRRASWRFEAPPASRDGANGVVTLEGVPEDPDLGIRVAAPGFQPASVAVTSGAADVGVTLLRAARFEIRVNPGRTQGTGDLHLQLDGLPPAEGYGIEERTLGLGRGAYAQPQRMGVIDLDDLPAGRATATLLWRGSVIWGPQEFELTAGGTAGPPGVVDVAALLRRVEISVLRPDGSPAAGAGVWTRTADPIHGWRPAVADAQGRVVIESGPGSFEVAAHDGDRASGCAVAPAAAAGPPGGGAAAVALPVQLRARTPQKVRIRVAAPPVVPGARIEWDRIDLAWTGPAASIPDTWRGPARRRPGTPEPEAGAGGVTSRMAGSPVANAGAPAGFVEAELSVLQPGTYLIGIGVRITRLRGSGSLSGVRFESPRTLVIPETPGPPIDVTVSVDPAELERIVEDAK